MGRKSGPYWPPNFNVLLMFSQYIFLQIGFATSVYLNRIDIYETFNSDAVIEIEAKSPDDQWLSLYYLPAGLDQSARIFSPFIKVTQALTLARRITPVRVAVFFFVFPISRSAHPWAPDEVKKKFFFVK